MDQLQFRPALPQNKKDILALQVEVFHKEQEIPVELITQEDPTRRWWCAFEGETLVGTIAAWEEADGTHMGRFALAPSFRGKKGGTGLLRFALEETFAAGIDTVIGEARDVSVHILENLGGRATGRGFPFYKGNVTPVAITREEYFRAKNK